jgi:metal-responsive CopG/Arc/MetJ family transcriptional regulator
VGRGAKRINISMERGLLDSADEFAKQKGITRARLIAESVRAFRRRAA